jgi:hypothetical protein
MKGQDSMAEDLFKQENAVKGNWFQLNEVGHSVKGVLVDKKIVPNTLKNPVVNQTVYTIMQDDGTTVFVGGRGNSNPQVIAGLEQCKMGQYVGVKYEGERENPKPGQKPAKIVRVYTNSKFMPEVLENYRTGGMSLESAEDLVS